MRHRLLLLIAGLPAVAFGQAPDTSYFPLDVGNSWTYAVRVQTSPTAWETLIGDPHEIGQTVAINDTAYTEVAYPHAIFGTLHRVDEVGRVWVRADGVDRLLFDVTRADGETYTFPDVASGNDYVVRVERNVSVDTFLGRFENAIRFSFDIPEMLDDETGITLAPGVGVVAASTSFFGDYFLYAASVGGRVVTSAGVDGPSRLRPALAAPNPFTTSTTIRLPEGPAGYAHVEVVDLLGRHVATLLDGPVGPGEQSVTWAASGAPSGPYLVRIHRGGLVQTLRLVRAQ